MGRCAINLYFNKSLFQQFHIPTYPPKFKSEKFKDGDQFKDGDPNRLPKPSQKSIL